MKLSRTVIAAALLVGALALLLVAWFFAGWSDVRTRQADERTRPAAAATRRSEDLAYDLRAEIATLVDHEITRPYFHYQNLFRDPRASASIGVAPSPLATTRDPLVLGYFQIDDAGKVTTPTINDDVPDLSEPNELAGNLAFRDEVSKSFGVVFRPPAQPSSTATLVAAADPAPKPRPRPPRPPSPPVVADAGVEEPVQQQRNEPQVQTIDNSSYQQNWNSNSIYLENNPNITKSKNVPGSVPRLDYEVEPTGPDTATASITPDIPPDVTPPTKPPVKPAVKARVVSTKIEKLDNKPVTIVVSPLELQTETFGGAPALVAVRLVETPDGTLTQGFVIDRAQMERWLGARGGAARVEHRKAVVVGLEIPTTSGAQIAPEWFVHVDPPAAELASSAASAAKLATTFLMRFVSLGALALLAAALVVVMVSRAERLARERSQFAAAAAHELRTPLAGLQLYGDMLADGMGDPNKQRDYARRMAEEAARLGRVVSNVLGFSQLERGNLSVDAKPGDVAAELAELASRAEPALDRAGAALALEVAPDLRAVFDRDGLARIVGNLLDNAEKYSRDAEDRTITLGARAVDGGVEIEVRDHGPGVAVAARGKLFAPFARGVSADGPAGLGLGLALSQSLAKAMGGSLEYIPSSGIGARFVLRLAPA